MLFVFVWTILSYAGTSDRYRNARASQKNPVQDFLINFFFDVRIVSVSPEICLQRNRFRPCANKKPGIKPG